MWNWVESYFTFTSSQRNGVLFLITLAMIAFVMPSVYFLFFPKQELLFQEYEKEIADFVAEFTARKQEAILSDTAEPYSLKKYNPYKYVELSEPFKKNKRVVTYFNFDPNKIGIEEWMKLGFSERQAEVIESLKAKGFKFYQPEDLKKIYVVSDAAYANLFPYITIDKETLQQKRIYDSNTVVQKKQRFVLDINEADSSLFERQRGIGPSLASRIIRYRNRLGGFVSTSQISEVWGMPDSTFEKLKDRFVILDTTIQKIEINLADVSTLGKHPYINYPLAKVIVAYRTQHGNFRSIEDIKKVPIITDSIFLKIEPYILVEE